MNNNKLKYDTLEQLQELVDHIGSKLDILEALDDDTTCSGNYDLYDQLMSMFKCKRDLEGCLVRARKVVPTH